MLFAEGQPETIVEDIENMVRSYVEKVMMDYLYLQKYNIPFLMGFLYLNWRCSFFF